MTRMETERFIDNCVLWYSHSSWDVLHILEDAFVPASLMVGTA